MGNGSTGVGQESATRKPGQPQMAAAMPQQGAYVMGDNECTQQKLVRLVGCRDKGVRPDLNIPAKQFGDTKS